MSAGTGRIDLHLHTNISDGTDTPEELLENVRKAGLEVISVTDHDSFKGTVRISAMLREEDPVFITGVEFSCKDEEGKYHILGYGFDPSAQAINDTVRIGHGFRMEKMTARFEFLKNEFGFRFPKDEIESILALDNPGKPHLGNLMARYGFAENKDDAISNYINKLHVNEKYIRPEQAIEGILKSGGIPVLAHPLFGSGDENISHVEMADRLTKLTGFGLKGVEAFYSGFDTQQTAEMLDFAEQYSLYVTAGSDYHGSNKKIEIASTGLNENDEIPEGLREFLKAVGVRRI